MENTNTTMNLIIKQVLESDAMAYNKDYMAKPIDVNFGLFDNAYRETGKIYAKLKLAVQYSSRHLLFCIASFNFAYILPVSL